MRRRQPPTADELRELRERPTVTYEQGAALWGVGETLFRSAVARGEIDVPVIAVGRRRVIPTAALLRLIDGSR